MISDAKSLRISDIHIDVRAWEDKACNIVIRSFCGQRRFSVGTGQQSSATHQVPNCGTVFSACKAELSRRTGESENVCPCLYTCRRIDNGKQLRALLSRGKPSRWNSLWDHTCLVGIVDVEDEKRSRNQSAFRQQTEPKLQMQTHLAHPPPTRLFPNGVPEVARLETRKSNRRKTTKVLSESPCDRPCWVCRSRFRHGNHSCGSPKLRAHLK
jgi:hypothetical protein